MQQLNNQQVEAHLHGLSEWQPYKDPRDPHQPNLISKTLIFPTFAEAMRLAQQVARATAGDNDHLGLSVYGFPGHAQVTLALRTFSPDETAPPFGVTDQDIALARKIEAVISETT